MVEYDHMSFVVGILVLENLLFVGFGKNSHYCCMLGITNCDDIWRRQMMLASLLFLFNPRCMRVCCFIHTINDFSRFCMGQTCAGCDST